MSKILFKTTLNSLTNSQRCTVFCLRASKVDQKTNFLQNGWISLSSEALGVKTVYIRELIMEFKVVHIVVSDNFYSIIELYDQIWQNSFEESDSKNLKLANFFHYFFLSQLHKFISHERIFADFGYVVLCILRYWCCEFRYSTLNVKIYFISRNIFFEIHFLKVHHLFITSERSEQSYY